jgi:hypothetical protein
MSEFRRKTSHDRLLAVLFIINCYLVNLLKYNQVSTKLLKYDTFSTEKFCQGFRALWQGENSAFSGMDRKKFAQGFRRLYGLDLTSRVLQGSIRCGRLVLLCSSRVLGPRRDRFRLGSEEGSIKVTDEFFRRFVLFFAAVFSRRRLLLVPRTRLGCSNPYVAASGQRSRREIRPSSLLRVGQTVSFVG